MKAAYIFAIVFGLGLFVYVYGIEFDSYSESALIQMTPVWFLPLFFGIYGFVAEKLIHMVDEGKAPNFRRAIMVWLGALFGLLGFAIFFPFLFVKGKNSMVVALTGTAVWGLLLAVFIFAIFPAL